MAGALTRMLGRSGTVAITIGNSAAVNQNITTPADNQFGSAWQAGQSGTVNFITITGHLTISNSVNYRLCIYAATNQTTWSGALLGQTADQTSLNALEVKRVALLAPVSIVSGSWYAITVQTAASMPMGCISGGQASRQFADTYSDGAALTAGASSANSSATRCLFASTL